MSYNVTKNKTKKQSCNKKKKTEEERWLALLNKSRDIKGSNAARLAVNMNLVFAALEDTSKIDHNAWLIFFKYGLKWDVDQLEALLSDLDNDFPGVNYNS